MKPVTIKTGKLITLKMAYNGITPDGIDNILNLLYSVGAPSLSQDIEWVWATKRGTLPKRIASDLYNNHKYKLSEALMTRIGTESAAFTDKREVYHFDLCNKIEWRAGEFGDKGSCFFTDRIGALRMIERYGFAIRFFTDKTGSKGYGS